MNIIQLVLNPLTKHYADFSGRSGRQEFWVFIGVVFLGYYAIASISSNQYVVYAYQLALLLPTTSIVVRRLHDIGKSGWLTALIIVPVASYYLFAVTFGNILSDAAGHGIGIILAVLIVLVFYPALGILFLYWFTRPSQLGQNQYNRTTLQTRQHVPPPNSVG
jgi:uncharacterized membrane protein YhaH (DUF805 family)